MGIGTDLPSARLDVNGSTRLRGLTTAGVVITDVDGNLSSATAASLDPTTASNGLTKVGNDFRLGGTLAAATTIAQGGNAFSLTGTGNVGIGTTTPIQKLDVATGSLRVGTFEPFTAVTATNQGAHLQWNRSVNDGETWLINHMGNGTANAGIRFGGVTTSIGTTPTEWARFLNNGNFGIGTTAPSAKLDVNGSTRLRGLTTAGVVTTDGSGNLSSATAASLDPTTASNGLTKTGNDFRLGGTLTQTTTVAQGSNFFALTGTGKIGLGAAAASALGAHVSLQTAAITEPGLEIGLTGSSTAIALKTEHNGSNFIVRPVLAGGTVTAIENTAGNLAINPTLGNVGIGTDLPSARLDVNGSTRLRGLTGTGTRLVTTDNIGNLSSATAASLDPTTASNGLTKTGNDFRLGGALTQATAISGVTTANTFDIGGTAAPRLTNTTAASAAGNRVLTLKTNYAVASPGSGGRISFTDNSDAELGRVASIDEGGAGGIIGLGFSTNNGGANLAERLRISGSGNVGIGTATPQNRLDLGNSFGVLPTDVAAKKLAVYQNGTGSDFYGFGMTDGQMHLYTNAGATSAPKMTFNNTGNVGIGTDLPSARLDVNGSTRLRGLTTAGVVTTDASGNLSSSTGASSFIQNTTTQQATSNFNISGAGTVGGLLTASGGATVTGATSTTSLTVTGLTAGSVPFIGSAGAVTQNNANLFFDNANNRLGIGTASPATRLQVVSADNLPNTFAEFQANNLTQGVGIWYDGIRKTSTSINSNLAIDAKGTGSLVLNVSGGGNVGIGTHAPAHPLQVMGGSVSSGAGAFLGFFDRTDATKLYNWYAVGGRSTLNLATVGVSNVDLLTVTNAGNVGIGTINPIAKLHVNGSVAATDLAGSIQYFCKSGGFVANQPLPGGGARTLSAYFEGGEFWVNNCIVAGAMNVSSDRRIKRVVGLSDRATDLATLNKIRVTNYTYIDRLANTDKVVKKVIAQEIQALMPVAVNTSYQAIPNVYEKATRVAFANGRVRVTTAKAHELPAAGGKMRLYTPANVDLNADVTVVDAHTFSFASEQAYESGLFVYGKFVDDFLSVDYDAIAMLNVSATQELTRQVAELQKQNAALQAGRAADQSAAAADHASLLTLQAQMTRLLGEGAQARK